MLNSHFHRKVIFPLYSTFSVELYYCTKWKRNTGIGSNSTKCPWPLLQVQYSVKRVQAHHTHTFAHLAVFPRIAACWAARGHWHRTCLWSALGSSTACPWPGQIQGTWESLPPYPDWPAPSCSSLPGTRTKKQKTRAQRQAQKYLYQGQARYALNANGRLKSTITYFVVVHFNLQNKDWRFGLTGKDVQPE